MKTAAHKKPGKIETRVSLALMAVLVVIALGIFSRQDQMNPAVTALRPESRQALAPPAAEQPALIDTGGTGIQPFSPPERFGPDTLYEKINGRADLYLSSGFVSLKTQRFTADPAAGNWVEIFAYDMGSPENAFSVFSTQRREGAHSDDIAPQAYRTENALFVAQGNVYLEFIGTDASPQTHETMGMLARTYLAAQGGTTAARTPGAELFPADGLVADSLQLIAANAFGHEQLDRIFTADFQFDGQQMTAFVSRRPDAAAATTLAENYQRILVSYGASRLEAGNAVSGAAALQMFDTVEIVFSRGRFLAGVHEADDLAAAMVLAGRLAGHLAATKD